MTTWFCLFLLLGAPNALSASDDAEEAGSLSTDAYLAGGYWNRVHRLAEFYWDQSLPALPADDLPSNRSELVIRVHVDASGAVTEAEVAKSCGADSIDEVAIRVLRSAARFPAPPDLGDEWPSHTDVRLQVPERGADLADDDTVRLNGREFQYASYYNGVRRRVNFFWQQCLAQLPRSTELSGTLITAVSATFEADGELMQVAVVDSSGREALDQCVLEGFRAASPFTAPPVGLLDDRRQVHQPEMAFTVQVRR